MYDEQSGIRKIGYFSGLSKITIRENVNIK